MDHPFWASPSAEGRNSLLATAADAHVTVNLTYPSAAHTVEASDGSRGFKRKIDSVSLEPLRALSTVHLRQKVGEGTFGVVFKAFDRMTDEVTALKQIKVGEKKGTRRIICSCLHSNSHIKIHCQCGFPVTALREIRALKSLNHPNIVQLKDILVCSEGDMSSSEQRQYYVDHGIEANHVFMMQEFVPYNLGQIIRTKKDKMTLELKNHYIKQLLDGVYYIHNLYSKHGQIILHRDLKPDNILVTSSNVIKIADLGSNRMAPLDKVKDFQLSNQVITLWYRCPEVIFGSIAYGAEVDMWSVACIIFEIMTGRPLFHCDATDNKKSDSQIIEQIFKLIGTPNAEALEAYAKYSSFENFRKLIPENKSSCFKTVCTGFRDSLVAIIRSLLDPNPAKRLNADKACDAFFDYLSEYPKIDPTSLPKFNPEEVIALHDEIAKKWEESKRRKDNPTDDAVAVVATTGGGGGARMRAVPSGTALGVSRISSSSNSNNNSISTCSSSFNNSNSSRSKLFTGTSKFKMSSSQPNL